MGDEVIKSLKDAAILIRETVNPSQISTDTPYIGLEHIEENSLRLSSYGWSTQVNSSKSRFRKGDILFGKLRPYFRKVIRAPFDGICSTDIWVVRAKEDVDQGYLYYWMASQDFVDEVSKASEGTKMPRASWEYASNLQKTFPPLAEQRRIAHILGTLDDKIELNRRMNATLEAIARALFKSWFVDFDPVHAKAAGRPSGLPPEIDTLFPDSFVDSELGPIPRGWEVTSLGKLFPDQKECVLTGPFGSNLHAHDYRNEGVPLILVKNINHGRILEEGIPLVGYHKVAELERYRLEVGDIVFSRVGAVGRTAYVYSIHEGWLFSGQTLRVRVADTRILNSRFLAQIYAEPQFVSMVETQALGTTRSSLNTELLKGFKFICPPTKIQDVWSNLTEPGDTGSQRRWGENKTLSSLRDMLLPRLLQYGDNRG